MSNGYLNIEAQLLSHPNITRQVLGRFWAATTMSGDAFSTWKLRDTGTHLERVWSSHWDTPPMDHFWLYNQLLQHNFNALYQLGPNTGWNFGELYVALYAAFDDGVAYLVMTTRTGKNIGVDTGWRPIELRGASYHFAITNFHY